VGDADENALMELVTVGSTLMVGLTVAERLLLFVTDPVIDTVLDTDPEPLTELL
jgi:hypothetical protein